MKNIELRDYYAAMAMQALIASKYSSSREENIKVAFEYADSMVAKSSTFSKVLTSTNCKYHSGNDLYESNCPYCGARRFEGRGTPGKSNRCVKCKKEYIIGQPADKIGVERNGNSYRIKLSTNCRFNKAALEFENICPYCHTSQFEGESIPGDLVECVKCDKEYIIGTPIDE